MGAVGRDELPRRRRVRGVGIGGPTPRNSLPSIWPSGAGVDVGTARSTFSNRPQRRPLAARTTLSQASDVTSAAKKILEEALALSEQEREELVSALSSSLEPVELSPEWSSEIGRRIEKIGRGEAEFLDAEAHLAELRQKHTD